MNDTHPEEIFHPELLPRKGEFVAWGLTLITAIVWLVFTFLDSTNILLLFLLFLVFLISAIIIRLGNWMDRHTTIKIVQEELIYHDGFREIRLSWENITKVEVFPSNWGKKVRVLGVSRRFSFRTLGEVTLGGELKGYLGFKDGEIILKTILHRSGLVLLNSEEDYLIYTRKNDQ
jgi:hypothetical protein